MVEIAVNSMKMDGATTLKLNPTWTMNNKGVGNSKNQRTERFLFAGKQNLHFLQKTILLLSKTNLIKQILNDSISLFKYLLMLHKKKCGFFTAKSAHIHNSLPWPELADQTEKKLQFCTKFLPKTPFCCRNFSISKLFGNLEICYKVQTSVVQHQS